MERNGTLETCPTKLTHYPTFETGANVESSHLKRVGGTYRLEEALEPVHGAFWIAGNASHDIVWTLTLAPGEEKSEMGLCGTAIPCSLRRRVLTVRPRSMGPIRAALEHSEHADITHFRFGCIHLPV